MLLTLPNIFFTLKCTKTNLLHIHAAQAKYVEKSNVKINEEDITVTTLGKLFGVKISNNLKI